MFNFHSPSQIINLPSHTHFTSSRLLFNTSIRAHAQSLPLSYPSKCTLLRSSSPRFAFMIAFISPKVSPRFNFVTRPLAPAQPLDQRKQMTIVYLWTSLHSLAVIFPSPAATRCMAHTPPTTHTHAPPSRITPSATAGACGTRPPDACYIHIILKLFLGVVTNALLQWVCNKSCVTKRLLQPCCYNLPLDWPLPLLQQLCYSSSRCYRRWVTNHLLLEFSYSRP